MRIAFSLLLIATAGLSSAAMAQTAAETAACKPDFEKFCQGVEPGGGRILECLAKHMSDLSPDCQKVVKAHNPG